MSTFIGARPNSGYRNIGNLKINAAVKEGTPLGADSTAGMAVVATTGNFLGFVTRDVVSAADHLALRNSLALFPNKALELPFKQNVDYISLEMFDEIEVGGSAYVALDPDTGYLAANTAVGTSLSLYGGKWRVKQTNDIIHGTLIAHLDADADGDLVFRILVAH